MRTTNEFWIVLHDLAQAVAAEGTSNSERKRNVVESFREMPRIAQREVASQLSQLITFLPDVYVEIVPAMAEPAAEMPSPTMSKRGPISLRDGSTPRPSADGDQE